MSKRAPSKDAEVATSAMFKDGEVANQDVDARRRDPRRAVNLLIDYQSLDQFFNDYATNISLGGVFIRSRNPLPVGTRLRVAFSLPGLEKMVETVGEVAHVMDGRSQDGFVGMGIRFNDLDSKAKGLIDKLVTSNHEAVAN